MGLTSAFHTSASGLRVSQNGLAVVGNNIANADTEGYSRQRAEISAYDPVSLGPNTGYMGRGAFVERISRAEDRFLELQVLRDRTTRGYFGGRETILASVERLYTENAEPAMGAAFDQFFNAASEVTQDATSQAARNAFVRAAEDVATSFQTMDRDLRTLQRGIDDTLQDRLREVNAIAARIADANARIVSGEAGEGHANDFRDLRDQAIRELSELVDVNVLPQKDGTYTVEIANGFNIVQGDRHSTLEGTPAGPGPQGLINIELVGINGGRTDIHAQLRRGEIGGLLDVRDNVLADDLAELDQMAFTFATEVNAVHQQGFGLDGNNARDLYDVPAGGAQFSAANLQVNALITGNPRLLGVAEDGNFLPGDNRNFQALTDLQDVQHGALGGATFNRRYAEILHDVGQTTGDNMRALQYHDVRAAQSEGLRESVEGVSIDDEMLDLTRFQKHFEANSRVVTTVTQLLDTVLQLLQ